MWCVTVSKVLFPNISAYALASSCTTLLRFLFCNSVHNKIKYCNLNLGVPQIALKINSDAKNLVAFKQGSYYLRKLI
jgi:hypothetical protein